jgi:hypothetical protein
VTTHLDDVSCASLPTAALGALAGLRCEPHLRVAFAADRLWLRWEGGNERVLHTVMPLAGCALFARREQHWYQPGRALPSFEVPDDLDYRPLFQLLFPAPVQPLPPPAHVVRPLPITLVPDTRPRPTTALLCPVAPLLGWADCVPAARLASLQGMLIDGQVLIVGRSLPELASGERFWGHDVLMPLGFRAEPELPESALVAAAHLEDDALLLLLRAVDATTRVSIVGPRTLLQPLTRAGLRLAAEEVRS